MLKFFRLYQKYILAVGAVVLMVAFLIPQATQMFTPSAGSRVIGRADGDKLRQRDIETAAAEMQVLARLSPLFTVTHEQDPTAWALAVRDAQQLGLSAGPGEVAGILGALQIDDADVNRLAASVRADAGFVHQAIRHWIMVETYRGLALGEMRTTPLQRLAATAQIAESYGPQAFPQMASYLGQPRLSAPLLRRVIVDQQSTVAGKLLVIPADKAVQDIPEPSEQALVELFEQYKDATPPVPGQGFGYRIEPRVKLDYLTIPFADVLGTIDADEVEAIAYHERNPQRFQDDAGRPLDYDASRAQVIEALRQDKAQQKIDLMIRRARAILMETPEFRRLPEDGGYKVLPEGYEPLSLRVVADRLEDEFSVRPAVRYERDRWLGIDDLVELEGIGISSLADRPQIFFFDYILSAREMEPGPDNALTGLRLQTNVVSQPLRGLDGSRHIFRLVAAEPAHAPANLDAVREQVVADARKVAAYQSLSERVAEWTSRAVEQGLDKVADDLGLEVTTLPALRRPGVREQDLPNLPGVGRSLPLLRAIYDRADQLLALERPIDELPVSDRLVAAPLPQRSALALFLIDDYKPISQSDYDRLAALPQLQGSVGFALLTEELPSPLSYDALKRRTNFVPAYGEERDDEAVPDQAHNHDHDHDH